MIGHYRTNLNTRNRIEKFFITFPQWDCSNVDVRQSILTIFPPFKFAISCVETHKDGGKHLHVIVALETRRTPAEFRQWVFSCVSDEQANRIHIGSVRAIKQAIEYIHKEDTDVYTVGTVPKYNSQKKSLTKDQIEIKIMEEQMEATKRLDRYHEQIKYQQEVGYSHWLRELYMEHVKAEAQRNFYDLVEQDKVDNTVEDLNECVKQWIQEYIYDDVHQDNKHFDVYLQKKHNTVYADLKW